MPGGTSHLLEIIPVANHLINDMGHEVALLIEDWDLKKARSKLPPPPPNGAYKSPSFLVVSPYANMDDGRLNFEKQVKASKGEFISSLKEFISHQGDQCTRLLMSKPSMDKIKEFQPDLIIADTTYPCSSMIADILHVPKVLFCPTKLLEPVFALALGYRVLPSTVPAHGSGRPAPKTFIDRFTNWALYSLTEVVILPLFHKMDKDLRTEFQIPERSHESVKLFLINADFAIEFPRQLPDGIKLIGPLLAAPAKPLPKDSEISKLIESSGPDGFIFVSFGSVFVLTDPAEIKTLASVLSSLSQYTIIWRITEGEVPNGLTLKDLNLGSNVHTVSWAPQNDILGSTHLAAFISHGGTNSVYEAAYHGVPQVNIPFMADHKDHAVRAEARGFGLTVSRNSLAEGDPQPLLNAIQKIITEPKFRQAAQRVGGELRAHPTPAPMRAAEWIAFALNLPENSSLMMSDPTGKSNWFVRRSHDVHAVLGIIVVVLVALVYFLFSFLKRALLKVKISTDRKIK